MVEDHESGAGRSLVHCADEVSHEDLPSFYASQWQQESDAALVTLCYRSTYRKQPIQGSQ
jgi:hypothetical protein